MDNKKKNKYGPHRPRSKLNKTSEATSRIASNETKFVKEEDEIKVLNDRINEESPAKGTQQKSDGKMRFDSMPLSQRTLQGLHMAKLSITTDIQAAALPHALCGRDILGAAKTGSGKTLAFIIPVLEKLFRERWSTDDGLGAVIITPTRELALQIFEVLRTAGRKHQFSAGLVTGGKKEFEGEQERIVRMNIVIATPGRLLQHLEQTSGFDASQLQILVLDEADRILDLGFKQQLDGILDYLPASRQTLLFSATQTKSVKDLARLSLNHPEYLAVHADDSEVTPKQLVQNYVVCNLQEKLDVLFSFIKTHLKSKIIVFFSTCAQVRFVFECFCGMQPGIPLTALHGKVKQEKRTIIYMDFLKRPSACLFATDIAARGLDFPNVDWVIQADAPEDSSMYIHRVGRTARYTSNGRALLLLMPVEEKPVLENLQAAGVPIRKLTVNPNHRFSVANQASALLAAQPDFRNYAKKAFSSYLRSLQLLPHYPILDIKSLPLDGFATALGLPFTPEIPVIAQTTSARDDIRGKKNVNRALDKLKKQIKEAKEAKKRAKLEGRVYESSDSESDAEEEKGFAKSSAKKEKTKTAKIVEANTKRASAAAEEGSDDDFLEVKKVHNWSLDASDANNTNAADGSIEVGESSETERKETKKEKKEKGLKVKIAKDGLIKVKNGEMPKKAIFDEFGNVVDQSVKLKSSESKKSLTEVAQKAKEYAELVKSRVDEGRKEDVERDKQRLREARLKRKQAERDRKKGGEAEEETGATLSFPVEETFSASGSESDDGDASDASEQSDDSDNERNRNVRYNKKRSNSDDDTEEYEGSDREEYDGSDSSNSDVDSSDDGEDMREKMREQERAALRILESKNKRSRIS